MCLISCHSLNQVSTPTCVAWGILVGGTTGSPTHCIRFCWNDVVQMTYKLNEHDETWRPLFVFDQESKSWVRPTTQSALFYEVIAAARTEHLLSTVPAVITQKQYSIALRASVLRCGESFEGHKHDFPSHYTVVQLLIF